MTSDLIQPFNAQSGALVIDAVGTPAFGELLLGIANSICPVDELFGYVVADDAEPQVIVTASTLEGAPARVAAYLKRFYRHDPAVRQIWTLHHGESFVQRIRKDEIIPYDYRDQCFALPHFAEKLTFGWRGQNYIVVLSFYCIAATDSALARLANLANLSLSAFVRHFAPKGRRELVRLLEERLERSFPELTARERQVCAHTIAGHDAAAAGRGLGIAPGTVLTYRQRAYQRYGFSKAADFLPKLLD